METSTSRCRCSSEPRRSIRERYELQVLVQCIVRRASAGRSIARCRRNRSAVSRPPQLRCASFQLHRVDRAVARRRGALECRIRIGVQALLAIRAAACREAIRGDVGAAHGTNQTMFREHNPYGTLNLNGGSPKPVAELRGWERLLRTIRRVLFGWRFAVGIRAVQFRHAVECLVDQDARVRGRALQRRQGAGRQLTPRAHCRCCASTRASRVQSSRAAGRRGYWRGRGRRMRRWICWRHSRHSRPALVPLRFSGIRCMRSRCARTRAIARWRAGWSSAIAQNQQSMSASAK